MKDMAHSFTLRLVPKKFLLGTPWRTNEEIACRVVCDEHSTLCGLNLSVLTVCWSLGEPCCVGALVEVGYHTIAT